MRQVLRAMIGVIVGLTTLLVGQLVLENLAWWWTGETGALDWPLSNAAKFAVAATAGLAVGAKIALPPTRYRRPLEAPPPP